MQCLVLVFRQPRMPAPSEQLLRRQPVPAPKREVGEQLWNALVEDGSIVATGFVPES